MSSSLAKMKLAIELDDGIGTVVLELFPEEKPQTVQHVKSLAESKIWDGTKFYRSDFVVQGGTHGSGRNPPKLAVNETNVGRRISNTRGTAALAHFDVPDNGAGEFFISVQDNPHLDDAYGGYCVFGTIAAGDNNSFATLDAIASAVKSGVEPTIRSVTVRA